MSEVESVPSLPPTLQRIGEIERAGTLKLKGYSVSNIAEIMEITPAAARSLVQEYEQLVEYQIAQDPYFMEKMQQNVMRSLLHLDEISKEAWETVEVATDNGMVNARLQGLKLVLDVNGKRDQLLNLTGGQRADSEYIAKMQKVESVNQILSDVLRDVISECPRCREQARTKLAEAFSIMENVSSEDDDEADEGEVVE